MAMHRAKYVTNQKGGQNLKDENGMLYTLNTYIVHTTSIFIYIIIFFSMLAMKFKQQLRSYVQYNMYITP